MVIGDVLLAIILGYLIGSVPFGLILTRAGGKGDIRDIGSGNIGATNVLRTGSKKLAVATLALDMAKGFVAVALFEIWGSTDLAPVVAGLSAFVGHCFPVWLRFEGGKGVATFFGVLIAWQLPIAALAGLTWISVALVFRYSSLAALITAVLVPLFFLFFGSSHFVVGSVLLATLIFYRHRGNIERLRAGDESKIGASANTELDAESTENH